MWHRAVRRLCAAVGAVALGGAVVVAMPGAASASVLGVHLAAPDTITRGATGGSAAWSAPLYALVGDQLYVSASATHGAVMTVNDTCTASKGSCSIDSGLVTITSDDSAPTGEITAVTLTGSIETDQVELSAGEAATTASADVELTLTAQGFDGAPGSESVTKHVQVMPASGDEVLSVTSIGASPSTFYRGHGTTSFFVIVRRVGSTSRSVTASVQLVPDNVSGTAVTSANPTTVSFTSDELQKPVELVISVPADAAIGAASYHAVVTYDPTGSGTLTDTVTGAQRDLTVLGNPAMTVESDLIDTTAPGAFDPGDTVRAEFSIGNSGDGDAEFTSFLLTPSDTLRNLGSFEVQQGADAFRTMTGAADGDPLVLQDGVVTLNLGQGASASTAGTMHAGDHYTVRFTGVLHSPETAPVLGQHATIDMQWAVSSGYQYSYGSPGWSGTASHDMSTVALSLDQDPDQVVQLNDFGVNVVRVFNSGPDAAHVDLRVFISGGEFAAPPPYGCMLPDDFGTHEWDCAVVAPAGAYGSVGIPVVRTSLGQVSIHTTVGHVDEYNVNSLPSVGLTSTMYFVDHGLPTVSVPGAAWLPTLSSAVRVGWSGSDTQSGVASYDVQARTASYNGGFGAWTLIADATTATSRGVSLAVGRTTCVQVRARDAAGNVGDWSPQRCFTRALDDRALSATSAWTRKKGTAYYAGTFTATTSRAARLTRTGAQLSRVGIVATKCSSCGTVGVYVGKTLVKKVSLAASSTRRRQIVMLPAFAYRARTVTLKVLTSGKRVEIDGLVISRV